MVADTNFSGSNKPTPAADIASKYVMMADHDIDLQKRAIDRLGEENSQVKKSMRRDFTLASLALVGTMLGGMVSYSAWTVPVEERANVVQYNKQAAHQTCVEKIAAGHISNTEAEIATCEKIFYAEEMESSATEYKWGGIGGCAFALSLLPFAFSQARSGRKSQVRSNVLGQEMDMANEKILTLSASRQTADAILAELNA